MSDTVAEESQAIKRSNPTPPKGAKPEPPPSPPRVFIPDWGKAERIERVLEFTQTLAKDPRGAVYIGQQVAEILATGKNVYVKVVMQAKPACTCLDDEDSGGNRFRDWDEDCPIHGRAALNAEPAATLDR